ncbi:MAG: phospholipase D-like domain-containing protein [Bacteroidales bacterium]
MAKFLTTKKTSSELEDLIIKANIFLILISPYNKLSKTYIQRLKEASSRGVRIIFVYGKEQIRDTQKKKLFEIKNIELKFFKNLHAKCYVNEKNLIVTSMNLYDYSEYNNREMGVLISRDKDIELYAEAFAEARSIISFAEPVSLIDDDKEKKDIKTLNRERINELKKRQSKTSSDNANKAYCIRCKSEIKFNPQDPYCPNCFKIWARTSQIDEEENFCHRCGKVNKSTISKPVCYTCYKKDPGLYEGVTRTIWL